jgi:hypothetical protein
MKDKAFPGSPEYTFNQLNINCVTVYPAHDEYAALLSQTYVQPSENTFTFAAVVDAPFLIRFCITIKSFIETPTLSVNEAFAL